MAGHIAVDVTGATLPSVATELRLVDHLRSADLYSLNTVSPNTTFSPENAMRGADPCEPTPLIESQDAASLLAQQTPIVV
jgi:hypothetical protein